MATTAPGFASNAGSDADPSPRLLVVTHTTGFRHPSIAEAEATLQRIADRTGMYRVSYARNQADVDTKLSPDGLKQWDAVFFANTTGDLGIPNLEAFLNWIRGGRAFLGAHSATDTYHNRPGYLEMIGAEFESHGLPRTGEVEVERPDHPIVRHFGATFTLYDEFYRFVDNPRSTSTILYSLKGGGGLEPDAPLAWTREYGRGRVFYTALGHFADVWRWEPFEKHLEEAIRWALFGP